MFNSDIAYDLFGEERLRRYQTSDQDSIVRILEIYRWNMALSAAYWALIESVEIFTRNRILRVLFPDGFVTQRALEQHTTGKFTIASDKIECGKMTFGFWVYFLSTENSNRVWTPLVFREFKPKTKRGAIHSNLLAIQKLRNRIGHHEAIWHLNHEDLNRKIFEVLEAISGEAVTWVESTTNLQTVLAERPTWLPNNASS